METSDILLNTYLNLSIIFGIILMILIFSFVYVFINKKKIAWQKSQPKQETLGKKNKEYCCPK